LYIGFFNGPVDGTPLIVLYSIVPWIGVMAAGYAFGTILTLDPARRNRTCLRLGLGAIALFLVLRGTNLYGDPDVERDDAAAGAAVFPQHHEIPGVAHLSVDDARTDDRPDPSARSRARANRQLARHLRRVPFFYYVLHIPLIHALALLVSKIRLVR